MQDCMGNEVLEGDTVVFLAANRRYLQHGVVIKITPQGVTIREDTTKWKVNRHHSLIVLYKKGVFNDN